MANAGVDLDVAVARARIRPFLIVMVDGRDGSYRSDTEWADTPHGRYESLVLDTVHAVDARWPTLRDRADRAIGGNSEGAFGAMNVALHHLETFSTVESWSGYFRADRGGAFSHTTAAYRRAYSPADYVASIRHRVRRLGLHAFLYVGMADGDRGLSTDFAARLRAAGADVRYTELPGRPLVAAVARRDAQRADLRRPLVPPMSAARLGLGLALSASVALNLGYLLQHRGSADAPPVTPRHPIRSVRGLLSSGAWLAGLACGLLGWALHVAALSRAPLSLVQAFVAGGLVLCVPMAVVALGHRVERTEVAGVALMSLALAGLSLGLYARPHSAHVSSAGLAAYLAAAGALAAALVAARRAAGSPRGRPRPRGGRALRRGRPRDQGTDRRCRATRPARGPCCRPGAPPRCSPPPGPSSASNAGSRAGEPCR